jgi:hypothetical protein
MSIEELRAQMAKDAKRDALKCLRRTSQQLGKAAYEIDKLIEEFQRIHDLAIAVSGLLHIEPFPLEKILLLTPLVLRDDYPSIQARLAVWEREKI